MLVVLSEIDCLKMLNSFEIYPDLYYTDLDLFKNHLVTLNDATVCVILGGTCRFNRKHIIELVKNLFRQKEDDLSGVTDVIVMTDTSIPAFKRYFKFSGNFAKVQEFSGWTLKDRNSRIIETLKSDYKESKIFLSDYDKGIYSQDKIDALKRKTTEDDIIPLIIKPNIKQMLGIS